MEKLVKAIPQAYPESKNYAVPGATQEPFRQFGVSLLGQVILQVTGVRAMRRDSGSKGGLRAIPALLAAVGLLSAAPFAAFAAAGSLIPTVKTFADGYVPFTPANIDPALARKVAATLGLDGLRFTPAARPSRGDHLVTMAVRVDQATARAITVHSTLADSSVGKMGGALGAAPLIAPTRYNLGSARGFQSFGAATAPKSLAVPTGIRDIAMADLSAYRTDATKPGKPARFQPRVAFEDKSDAGRSPRTIEAAGQQSVEVGGAYRVMKNLDVTAGLRVSQDRNRIAPLTDGVEDSKAVYVGTQFRF